MTQPITMRESLTNVWDILDEIYDERTRQDRLKQEGRFSHTCADLGHDLNRGLVILMEEVGEVARELCEWQNGKQPLEEGYLKAREELVQCAAICVAMIEGIDVVMETGMLQLSLPDGEGP